jgi:hypothetical protein
LILGLFNGVVSSAEVVQNLIKWWAISGFILNLLNDAASTA